MEIDKNFIAIMAALISVFSHIGYVNTYKYITGKGEEKKLDYQYLIACAIILYGLASVYLLILTSTSFFIWGSNLNIVSNFDLNHTLFSKSSIWISWIIMTIFYTFHIGLEPFGVKKFNTATYLIIFQISIVIILGWEIYFNGKSLETHQIKGISLVLLASTIALFYEIHTKGFAKIGFSGILIALLSTFFCASALFIDSEFANQVIKIGSCKVEAIAPYLFYEFTTFFVPALSITIFYIAFFGFKALRNIKNIFILNKNIFYASSFFSILQFVCSVFPLGFTENKTIPIIIIATTGLLSVIISFIINLINQEKISKISVFIYLLSSIISFYAIKLVL